MQYTVSSHGRPIGVTDLGFVRTGTPVRSGWFQPNEEGAKLMPLISALHIALRTFRQREMRQPRPCDATEPRSPDAVADVKEALARVEALKLSLHRPDGSVVPTEMVGIQDAEQLLASNEIDDPSLHGNGWSVDADVDGAVGDAVEQFFDGPWDHELNEGSDELADLEPWLPDDELPALPRYQIHVWLADDAVIP